MAKQLQDKIAIVTGASNRIGRGIAEIFAAEGAKTLWLFPSLGEQPIDSFKQLLGVLDSLLALANLVDKTFPLATD